MSLGVIINPPISIGVGFAQRGTEHEGHGIYGYGLAAAVANLSAAVDRALYEAKRAGRNQAMLASESSITDWNALNLESIV